MVMSQGRCVVEGTVGLPTCDLICQSRIPCWSVDYKEKSLGIPCCGGLKVPEISLLYSSLFLEKVLGLALGDFCSGEPLSCSPRDAELLPRAPVF